MLVEFGKANLLEKARQQPDKVRQVLDKLKTDGIWPTVETVRSEKGLDLLNYLEEHFDLKGHLVDEYGIEKHVFSHRIWMMGLLEVRVDACHQVDFPESVWVRESELQNYAIPTAYQKLIQKKLAGDEL